MLAGVERLVDLSGAHENALTGATLDEITSAIQQADVRRLEQTDGHFAATARDGQTVRMARTIGLPLRYFVAKMYHGPFLVVSDRLDRIFEWCQSQQIGWQFDPAYTRMIPAHYLVEVDQVGCPDPAPRYHRFFHPTIAEGSSDLEEAGADYIQTTYQAVRNWIARVPVNEHVAIAFSGGIDSTSVLLLARKAMNELGRDESLLRAFTLDLGGGQDALQAASVAHKLGFENNFEVITAHPDQVNLEKAISVIEDYHPLDVECAAMALCLLEGIRERYPSLKYLLDGDGGDENLKSYPLEDSDLTISSVLGNPLLYQEGWGIDAIKHSLTYSGGLSRGYVRTYAPAEHFSFNAFSPYTSRSVIASALAIPFEKVIADSAEKLASLKSEVVAAGVKAVTGIEMPVFPKRRFQDGAGGESYRQWRVSKAWCRQVFLQQWQEKLRTSWDVDARRRSGNEMTVPVGMVAAD